MCLIFNKKIKDRKELYHVVFLVISFITTKAKPYKQAGRQQHLLVKTARWRAINRLKICHVKDTVRVRSLSQSEPACSSNASCRRIHISSLQGYNKISLKKQQNKIKYHLQKQKTRKYPK